MRRPKPERIKGKLTLDSGETVHVLAIRGSTDPDGITRYTMTMPDGAPLDSLPSPIRSYWLETLPAMSSVEVLLRGVNAP